MRDTGPISSEEAREILERFCASHFEKKSEHARMSIPADPMRDDDLRMAAFIDQRDELLADMRELLKITDTRIPLGEKYAETAIRLEGCIDRLREKWGEK